MTDAHANVRRTFDAQPMMTSLGASLTAVANGAVEITAPILPEFGQQHGFAHAGVTFTLGDTAAGCAALTVMDADTNVVTAEIKINLTAPARGERLIARGRVVKPGRKLVVVTAEVYAVESGTETLVGLLQGTMVPVPL